MGELKELGTRSVQSFSRSEYVNLPREARNHGFGQGDVEVFLNEDRGELVYRPIGGGDE